VLPETISKRNYLYLIAGWLTHVPLVRKAVAWLNICKKIAPLMMKFTAPS